MSKTFRLQIITPERVFLEDDAEMLVVRAPDGEIGVEAGHAPMGIATEECAIRIKRNGEWREAAASDGFVTVTPDQVLMMVQTCEWPEEIDANLAQRNEERAREIMRQRRSMQEYIMAKSMMARAMVRLRVSTRTHKN
ncbi:MAG TPA: ATP synthase F1 subunit epsilon [Candidatus Avichristensenella intestinipullorum]|uniref:ATP synthase epsilon chain n=1 Tax=Candidatus Avichristensenella intestinipullorum TaxID=2840693 RepID=A0A9D0YVP9_9FIRM|nr:ATP synthase F1 subunit epsilon [Candidatus Avichristensenella intestinipullorum]